MWCRSVSDLLAGRRRVPQRLVGAELARSLWSLPPVWWHPCSADMGDAAAYAACNGFAELLADVLQTGRGAGLDLAMALAYAVSTGRTACAALLLKCPDLPESVFRDRRTQVGLVSIALHAPTAACLQLLLADARTDVNDGFHRHVWGGSEVEIDALAPLMLSLPRTNAGVVRKHMAIAMINCPRVAMSCSTATEVLRRLVSAPHALPVIDALLARDPLSIANTHVVCRSVLNGRTRIVKHLLRYHLWMKPAQIDCALGIAAQNVASQWCEHPHEATTCLRMLRAAARKPRVGWVRHGSRRTIDKNTGIAIKQCVLAAIMALRRRALPPEIIDRILQQVGPPA